ncbi:hypothetical protein D3C76_1732090 [compost metagenome]
MLEQIEKFGGCVIPRLGPLLQPFLIGVGQGTVGAAEAKHRGAENRGRAECFT